MGILVMIILMLRLRENPVVAIEISRNLTNGVRRVSSRDPNYKLAFLYGFAARYQRGHDVKYTINKANLISPALTVTL